MRRESYDTPGGTPGLTLMPESEAERRLTLVERGILAFLLTPWYWEDRTTEALERATVEERNLDGWGGHVTARVPLDAMELLRGRGCVLRAAWLDIWVGVVLLSDATDRAVLDLHPLGENGVSCADCERLLFAAQGEVSIDAN